MDSTLDSQLSSLDSPAVLAPALRKTEVRRNPIPSGGRHGSRRWPQRRIFVDVCLSRDSRVPEGLSMLVTMRPHPPFASPHKRRRCPALLLMRSQQKPPTVQGLGKHCGGDSASPTRHPGETHPPSSQLTSTIHPRTLIQGVIQNAHSQYTEADFCLSISYGSIYDRRSPATSCHGSDAAWVRSTTVWHFARPVRFSIYRGKNGP